MKPDEDEAEYGTWEFTAQDALEEERRLLGSTESGDIWPRWSDVIPSKFRRTYYCPPFKKNGVSHDSNSFCETIEIVWNSPRTLDELRKSYRRLPSMRKDHWSGVYRIFLPNFSIERLCGKDPTGTLYIGLAGTGTKSWSILRHRLMAAAKGDHHACRQWGWNDAVKQRFGSASLAVQWAYTGKKPDYKGDLVHEAVIAEHWLLHCYRYTFGEFPPLNEKA
jgi:hypothetical protein